MRYSTRFNDLALEINLATEPALTTREIDGPGTYADGSYQCSFSEIPIGPRSMLLQWRLRRRDGHPFRMCESKVEAAVPGLDLHRIFVPVLHEAIGKTDLISLPWSVEEHTFTSWSFPFIAALNRFDQNRFCMGLMDHVHAAKTRHSCYDEDAQLVIERLFDPAPRETEIWEETLYLSGEDDSVFDEVRAFARSYDKYHNITLPPAPPSAWEPVWCSWYGIKNDVDADYIRAMAPLLKEWGIGNIIVDAGWFTNDGFDLDTGHYIPDEEKFPDLEGLVEEVQAQDLTILLWCAPLFNIGGIRDVDFIQAHRFHPVDRDQPEDFLCPRCPEVRQYAWRTVEHLMQTYGCNGLKIDFIDLLQERAGLVCKADHPHDIEDYGEAVHDLLAGIYNSSTGVRSDALLEYRMNYSTLATRSFATSHRAQDAPFDPDHIRRMCTRLKSYIINPSAGRSGNVAAHTDPAYWLPQESPENVGRFMSSLITSAVPMLSMDLRALPAEHQRIIRAWLAFYRDNCDLLLFGHQQILSADSHHSLFSMHLGKEALWGVFTPTLPGLLEAPTADIRHIWILNGSAQSRVHTRIEGIAARVLLAQVYDRNLQASDEYQVPVTDGAAELDSAVEIGGAIKLVSNA